MYHLIWKNKMVHTTNQMVLNIQQRHEHGKAWPPCRHMSPSASGYPAVKQDLSCCVVQPMCTGISRRCDMERGS